MPQMYPLNWMLMFLVFVMIFMFSINKIFYFYNLPAQNNFLAHKSPSNFHNMWKW